MMDGMMMGMGLWALLLMVTLVALLVLAVLGIIWLWRYLGQTGSDRNSLSNDDDAARQLLRQRYAAGEIDDEEFKRRLAALTWR